MKNLRILFIALLATVMGTSCEKDKKFTAGTTPVKVRLTDAPGNFQEVNIDIKGVEFKMENGTDVDLNTTPGIYNLLDFVNGIDTLIASANVPSGTLSQVRLILGPNNSVKVDDVVHELSTPSAQQSGLKLNVHEQLIPGVLYELLLDFDANKSVVLKGNGGYQLKPVIRTIRNAISGSLNGKVITPAALPVTVEVENGVDTFTTVTDANGGFLLRGLPAGTYNVTLSSADPNLNDVVFNNVVITVGVLKELGDISF